MSDHLTWLSASVERARAAALRLARLTRGTPDYAAEQFVRHQALERARHHAEQLRRAGNELDDALLAEIAP